MVQASAVPVAPVKPTKFIKKTVKLAQPVQKVAVPVQKLAQPVPTAAQPLQPAQPVQTVLYYVPTFHGTYADQHPLWRAYLTTV